MLTEHCDPVVEVGPGASGLPSVREVPEGAGPLAALVAGAAALAARGAVDGVLLVACDLPFAEPVIAALVAAPTEITMIPTDDSGRDQYVCARYSPDALVRAAELLAAGERSLHALVGGLPPHRVVRLGGFDAVALADVDEPSDARRWGIEIPR